MRRRLVPLLAAGLLLLAGCGESPGYDDAAVESYLVKSQASLFGSAGDKARATCPADRELTRGDDRHLHTHRLRVRSCPTRCC